MKLIVDVNVAVDVPPQKAELQRMIVAVEPVEKIAVKQVERPERNRHEFGEAHIDPVKAVVIEDVAVVESVQGSHGREAVGVGQREFAAVSGIDIVVAPHPVHIRIEYVPVEKITFDLLVPGVGRQRGLPLDGAVRVFEEDGELRAQLVARGRHETAHPVFLLHLHFGELVRLRRV